MGRVLTDILIRGSKGFRAILIIMYINNYCILVLLKQELMKKFHAHILWQMAITVGGPLFLWFQNAKIVQNKGHITK